METYLNAKREELADREDMLAGIRLDDDFLDANEPFIVENPIFEDMQQNAEGFYALWGFTVHHFQVLYHEIEVVLYVAKRSRKRAIRLLDGFCIFLHWLRSASPIDSIVSAFGLRSPTLYIHLHKTGKAIHKVRVDRYIKS
jgi:hypothetical protein